MIQVSCLRWIRSRKINKLYPQQISHGDYRTHIFKNLKTGYTKNCGKQIVKIFRCFKMAV